MDNWKDNIRRVEPYVPGEQPKGENIIKLIKIIIAVKNTNLFLLINIFLLSSKY